MKAVTVMPVIHEPEYESFSAFEESTSSDAEWWYK
jgi:hypothetical protein